MNAGPGGEVSLQIDKSKSPHTRGSSPFFFSCPRTALKLQLRAAKQYYYKYIFQLPRLLRTGSALRLRSAHFSWVRWKT